MATLSTQARIDAFKGNIKAAGISNLQIADVIGISRRTLTSWLRPEAYEKHEEQLNQALAAIIAAQATVEESSAVEQDPDQAPETDARVIGMVALPTPDTPDQIAMERPDTPDPDDDRLPWESDDEEPDLTLERAIRHNVATPLLDNLKEVRGNVRDMNVLVGSALTFGLLSGNEYADLMRAIDTASSGMDAAQAILEEMMR